MTDISKADTGRPTSGPNAVSSQASGVFAALAANGSTAAVRWFGGAGSFMVWGTFGGGTAKLQMSPDAGVTWIDVDRAGDTYVTFTQNGEGGFDLGPCLLRVTLSGATAPTVNARVTTPRR
ncbi:hypothetical protein IVB12_15275 [Bradyrhizobium sp. 179]|uniref:hypothetical protein n=1 Tax=Bradyrhizobium sp. 179 TaxID=2782648 RepID=UPI001FFB8EE0|nr:hypothetical protein [Bradyrhizobium sp. 179]MCK1543276.1 hypothetical protein [Bradyrhizobium sp. 179]